MTVAEMIATLQMMPPNALVLTSGFNLEGYEVVRTLAPLEVRRRQNAPAGTLFGPNVWREDEGLFAPPVAAVLID